MRRLRIAFSWTAIAIALTGTVMAAVPTVLHYQGVLTDGGGVPITTLTSVTFTLWSSPSGGIDRWSETRNITPDSEGRFAILLGQAVPLHDSVFKMPPLYLGVQVAADPEMAPRSLLASNAFAFRIATIDGASGGNIVGDVEVLTSGTGSGLGVRDPGGNIGIVTPSYTSFVDDLGDTVTTIGVPGIKFVDPETEDTILSYDPDYSTIDIGQDNVVSDTQSVAIGTLNVVTGKRAFAIGIGNEIDSSNAFAVGTNNKTLGRNSFAFGTANVASGLNSFVSGSEDSASGENSAVLGGLFNRATNTSAVVAGGQGNRASGEYSVVTGGSGNRARGGAACIAGGAANTVDGDNAVVSGGVNNEAHGFASTVAGGNDNDATGSGAFVGGGVDNLSSGAFGMVVGGVNNRAAGNISAASGFRAKADHAGTYVWADSTASDFASTAINQYLIRASGGVGVGTTSPEAPLDVDAPGTEEGGVTGFPEVVSRFHNTNSGRHSAVTVDATAGFDAIYYLAENGTARWQIRNDAGSNDRFEIRDDVGIRRLVIDSIGQIGVAVTSPTRILHVVQGSATDPIADAWTLHSSIRWKKNVQTIPSAIDKIEKLRGVYYDEKVTEKHCLGLIAEEVGKVIPEVVDYEANGIDAQSVDYARLVALLIEGMKEQQLQLDGQRQQVTELKRRIETILQNRTQ